MKKLIQISEMWDKRYSDKEYAYGTDPNIFLKESLEKYNVKGSILLPAEGEGRNAVYAAKKGLDVTAFDLSIEGKKKALQLAAANTVSIQYEIGELPNLQLVNKMFDCVALIYAHFPPTILSKYHSKISDLVHSGGLVILEGFSTNHLPLRKANPAVGGPNKLEMLFTKESIQNDFSKFDILLLEEVETELKEGVFHNGVGSVIRFVGRKK